VSGYPIRIAVRVDFSDGSEHEYEVRGQDAVGAADLPQGPVQGFWPEGVVTTDVAKRMEHDRRRDQALAVAERKLKAVRDWAEHAGDLPGLPAVVRASVAEAAHAVLRILDVP